MKVRMHWQRPEPMNITSEIANYLPRGMRLGSLTQSLAYEAILKKNKGQWRTTQLLVDRVLTTLEIDLRCSVSQQALWKAITHRDLHRKHQVFL